MKFSLSRMSFTGLGTEQYRDSRSYERGKPHLPRETDSSERPDVALHGRELSHAAEPLRSKGSPGCLWSWSRS